MIRTSLIIGCLMVCFSIYGQGSQSVWLLSIGSANYEQNPRRFKEKGFVSYDNLPEANNSAILISELFKKYASADGKTILSNKDKMITKKLLSFEIDSALTTIKTLKKPNPLFILYYCGHGISENLAWNQFLIPGDYTYIPNMENFDQLSDKLIWLGEIIDKLDKEKIPYLIILDCCRKQSADNSFPEKQMQYFFSEQNVQTFKTLSLDLKHINEYHQNNPVVFSIAPGNAASIVDIPAKDIVCQLPNIDTTIGIGPISRRITLVVTKTNHSISKNDFIVGLTASNLDDFSSTSVSFYEGKDDRFKNAILFEK